MAKPINVNDLIAFAKSWLGVRYVWGGSTRQGVDCSGLVMNVFAKFGIQLPHLASAQQQQGQVINHDQARPGDVVFFYGSHATHTAIYLGNDTVIEAPQPGENVKITHYDMSPQGLAANGISFRRLVSDTGQPQTQNYASYGAASDGVAGDPGSANHLSESDYQAALGDLSGLIQAIPSLHQLVNQAVAGGWSANKFMQSVQQTPWWKQHNASARSLISLKYQDPAEYRTQIQNGRNSVEEMAHQLGVDLGKGELAQLANEFLTGGWDQQTLQRQVGNLWSGKGTPEGQAAQYTNQLHQIFSDQGVPMGPHILDERVKKLLQGKTTIDTYSELAKTSAMGMYPSIAPQLQSGATVRQIADPYVQTMSGLLETDPQDITMQDPMIKKALQGTTQIENGKQTAVTTPLYDFEKSVRSDPRWGQTQNAHDTMSSALLSIGRDFGFEG